jgi:hypothetical protein
MKILVEKAIDTETCKSYLVYGRSSSYGVTFTKHGDTSNRWLWSVHTRGVNSQQTSRYPGYVRDFVKDKLEQLV